MGNIENIFEAKIKIIITIIVMMGSMAFSKSGFYVIDGIINSTVDGDDVSKDVDYLMGFKFDIEKIHENGLIAGAVYNQRGLSASEDLYGIIEIDSKYNANYLSGYILKLFSVRSSIDLLVGLIISMMKINDSFYSILN